MALRQLVIGKKIEALSAQVEDLRRKETEIQTRAAVMKKREAQLEAAVEEVAADTSEADRGAVDEAVASFESDQAALDEEQATNKSEKVRLEDEIRTLQEELAELNKKATISTPAKESEQRKGDGSMSIRKMGLFGLDVSQRDAFLARGEVKEFLTRVRDMKDQTRGITGAELTIPEVVLDLLRDNLNRYSKLLKRVRVKPVKGIARQNLLGAVPEAVWMEASGYLNELEFRYLQTEVDGYMVGGFIPIPNALMEDSDENLAGEILDMLGQAIGLAIDKAILYGTGVKMPIGIVTRLSQTVQPSGWDDNGPVWSDLSSTNLCKTSAADLADTKFFKELFAAVNIAKANYSTGELFWAMNSRTRASLMAKSLTFNAAGTIVATQMGTLPIVGGATETLEFIPDGDIVGGYGSLYLMAERSGAKLEKSEHVRFLQNQTVFRGVARYDGKPVLGEGFVVFNINAAAPTKTIPFAADKANTADSSN